MKWKFKKVKTFLEKNNIKLTSKDIPSGEHDTKKVGRNLYSRSANARLQRRIICIKRIKHTPTNDSSKWIQWK